jgi:hypothetical protein
MRILQGAAGVKYFSVWKKFVLRLGRDFPQGGVRRLTKFHPAAAMQNGFLIRSSIAFCLAT